MRRILLIESDHDLRLLLTLVLGRAKYTVTVQANADRAGALLAQHPDFLAVICGYRLEGQLTDGLAVHAQFKALLEQHGARFVLLHGEDLAHRPELAHEQLRGRGITGIHCPMGPRDFRALLDGTLASIP